MNKYVIFFMLFFGFNAINSFSQEVETNEENFDEIIQEFFITETVYPQEKNEIQLTSVNQLYFYSLTRDFNTGMEIEYGITDRFQVSSHISYNYITGDDINIRGLNNLELGLLYNIYQKKSFSVSLSLETELPTAKKRIGESELEFEPQIIVAKQIDVLQVHFNFGSSISAEGIDELEYIYNMGILLPLNKVVATLEINGMYEDENFIYITPGLIYKHNFFEMGVGIPINTTQKEPKYGIVAMLVFEFGGDDD